MVGISNLVKVNLFSRSVIHTLLLYYLTNIWFKLKLIVFFGIRIQIQFFLYNHIQPIFQIQFSKIFFDLFTEL